MTPLRLSDLAGRRVGIWGLGEEGESFLRRFRERFPSQEVTVIDEREPAAGAAGRWRDEPGVRWRTGPSAVEELLGLEVVVKSPGVSLYRRELAAALEAGTELTSTTRLWFAELRDSASTIAVTGTKGKTTTASLIGHLVAAAGRSVEVAGNIGRPLLDLPVGDSAPRIWVVELSSYQLADLDSTPSWGVLLNLFPEHLDWHGGVERYYSDKLRIFGSLAPGRAIVNALDAETASRRDRFRDPVLFNDVQGFHTDGETIYWRQERLVDAAGLDLLGRHNLENACAALTVAERLGVDLEGSAEALRSFRLGRHRLSRLGEIDGVLWVDDSISTVPQAAMAGVAAFPGRRLTLLVGGYDRGLDYGPLAELMLERPVEVVITLPDSGPRIAGAIEAARRRRGGAAGPPRVLESRDLDHAVELARRETPAGGVVLLSPAAASYGRFRDHRERGRRFAEAAGF